MFSIIQSRLTGVENVVLVGDNDIVPYKRVPDETIISNERDYALDSFLKAGSPELASILLGYNLSDDYYVDAKPSDWQGRQLYVPTWRSAASSRHRVRSAARPRHTWQATASSTHRRRLSPATTSSRTARRR